MSEVIIIGLDIAKHVFHAHGADELCSRHQTGRAKGFVARTDAGSQTAHAGNRGVANKMARIVWALLVKQENYRAPVAKA
ncbi:hypothetical protein ACVWYJ_000601 [Bradyrhizobium sp. USDA 4471]